MKNFGFFNNTAFAVLYHIRGGFVVFSAFDFQLISIIPADPVFLFILPIEND